MEMENVLTIGAPYIKEDPVSGTCRLCSVFTHGGTSQEIWYEMDASYREYICTERSDTFLVALLPYLMRRRLDVVVEGKLSEQLYYQLTSFFIPSLSAFVEGHHKIIIYAELDNTHLPSAGAVGTGCSLGVDSFYTIARNTGKKAANHNITHITFFNAGSNGSSGGDEARALYRQRVELVRRFATESNLSLVMVDTNINEYLQLSHSSTHTYRDISIVLALQKLFSVYYYSSGCTVDEFNMAKIARDPAYADILFAHCLGNENTRFYITGLAEDRLEKVRTIVDFPLSYKYLNVCLTTSENCGLCSKCVRTQMELYALGHLEDYGQVFNLARFQREKNRLLMATIANNNQFNRVIRDTLKEKGSRIPPQLYLRAYLMRLTKPLRDRLDKSNRLSTAYRWVKSRIWYSSEVG